MLSLLKKIPSSKITIQFQYQFSSSPFISVSTASQLHPNPNTKFIDCRDPNEFAQQHISGAVHVNEIFTYLARSDQ
jgi:3-mercaptopyruvate sulfurtransferase SseA